MPERRFEGASTIACDQEMFWGDDVVVGPDVRIECERLWVGSGARIGVAGTDEFRYPGGLRLRGGDVRLGDGVRLGRHNLIEGGAISLGRGVRLGNDVTIKVLESFRVGAGGAIQDRGEIGGVDIEIGRRLWMLPDAKIGGGAAFEVHSRLRVGHWAHLGVRSLLNTARPITLGDEIGLGTGTSLYTHGAYASAIEGKPVSFAPIEIGNRTWIPGAVVNPGVRIGCDAVVAVGSVVTRDLPDGCLAAGAPAKVVRENAYPRPMDSDALARFAADFLGVFAEICSDRHDVKATGDRVRIGETWISFGLGPASAGADGEIAIGEHAADGSAAGGTLIGLRDRTLAGAATPLSERLLNQLRRYGIRFNYDAVQGRYIPWTDFADDLV